MMICTTSQSPKHQAPVPTSSSFPTSTRNTETEREREGRERERAGDRERERESARLTERRRVRFSEAFCDKGRRLGLVLCTQAAFKIWVLGGGEIGLLEVTILWSRLRTPRLTCIACV